MRITKEALSKMSISQLEGKLSESKAKFAEAATSLSAERQSQMLKARVIRGKAAQRRKELVSQILNIENSIEKIYAQTRITIAGSELKFNIKKAAASAKVELRRSELRNFGTYQTSLTDYEKILAWCDDMGIDEQTLNQLLNNYSLTDLAAMSGDEFYDQITTIEVPQQYNLEIRDSQPDLDTIMF